MSDPTALARKVKERQRLVECIVQFVRRIVVNHGENKTCSICSCHTHMVWELKNFANFSLKGDFGQTMMGGNSVSIAYLGQPVFHVNYQISAKECRVEKFAEGDWLSAFKKAMRNQKTVLAQLKREKQAQLRQSKTEKKEQQSRERLQHEADRLKIQ